MNSSEKEEDINNNKENVKSNNEEFLLDNDFDNLNINQEIDIKENPKKFLVDSKKKLLKLAPMNLTKANSSDLSAKITNQKKYYNKRNKKITFNDIYLGNDMFFCGPKSYPRDYEKNNKYLLEFSRKNLKSKKFSSNMNIFDLNKVLQKTRIEKNEENQKMRLKKFQKTKKKAETQEIVEIQMIICNKI